MLFNVSDPISDVCGSVIFVVSESEAAERNIKEHFSIKSVLLKDDSSVTSYTSKMPIAPL
jgi:hypothetical protein